MGVVFVLSGQIAKVAAQAFDAPGDEGIEPALNFSRGETMEVRGLR